MSLLESFDSTDAPTSRYQMNFRKEQRKWQLYNFLISYNFFASNPRLEEPLAFRASFYAYRKMYILGWMFLLPMDE